ncbi:hypothetical protein HII12_000765 [Brettanomyces bruxellensis]|uniref:RRM domain-containing protein n=1 Tax=Dekkera bruxellensis TaxID=5007 RepID=A0A8H6EZ69_DEKBR|nr:hypothetical protein HII12_000765 [Brettanomyces bruxellensis]
MSILEDIQGKSPTDLKAKYKKLLTYDKINKQYSISNVNTVESYTFDNVLKRWVPNAIENEERKEAEKVENKNGTDISKIVDGKRKVEEDEETEKSELKRLPSDATAEEIQKTFGRCGLIDKDLKTGERKIKLYKDANGSNKGDGLIQYYKAESCDLAIEMLNGTPLRPSESNKSDKLTVSKAIFEGKKESKPKDTKKEKTHTPIRFKEKKKMERTRKELDAKLADWSDSENEDSTEKRMTETERQSVVILKPCFTLKLLNDDPEAAKFIQQDIKQGCEELGKVSWVRLYDGESDGVVAVKFESYLGANSCLQKMNGRYYGGHKLEAVKWDGVQEYKSR